MASGEHSKVVVLLWLFHCLLLPSLFCVEDYGWSLFCFAIISLGKKYSWLPYFNCFLMSFDSSVQCSRYCVLVYSV